MTSCALLARRIIALAPIAVLLACGGPEARAPVSTMPHAHVALDRNLPDLVPEVVSCAPSALRVRIRNQGAASAPATRANIAMGNTVFILRIPPLMPGASILRSVVPPGEGPFTVTVDVGDQVREQDEDNNRIQSACIF